MSTSPASVIASSSFEKTGAGKTLAVVEAQTALEPDDIME
jgi:hypothetical protein